MAILRWVILHFSYVPNWDSFIKECHIETSYVGTHLMVWWLRLHPSNAGGRDSISGQGTRPLIRAHIPLLKIPHAATKILMLQVRISTDKKQRNIIYKILLRNRSPAQVGCMRQVLGPGALGRPRGIGWRGRWEGGSGWGTHVNPWLIHVNVW